LEKSQPFSKPRPWFQKFEKFENFETETEFAPKTAATSEIRAGELFTGLIDPADSPWRR